MLDTVKLQLKDYEITDFSTLEVQPARYVSGTGEVVSEFPLFKNSSGKVFYGSKAFLNTPKWNLTVKPVNYSPSGTACYIHFSVPGIHNGNNFYSVGEQGTEAVINQVEQQLTENGIKTNLQNAQLSRVDTFKNIQADQSFESYSTLFQLLKCNRGIKRDYGTTFLLSNSQQEFTVYDKLVEMQNKGISTADFPENTQRYEHRLLNRNKINSVYGFSAVADIFKGGYAVIKEKQLESWKKSLFSYSVEEVVSLGSKQLEQEMALFKSKFGSTWFQWFLKSYGAYYLAKFAGVEVVKVALENLEADRMKVWRTVKLLEQAKREIDFVKTEEKSQRTVAELYQELQEKVCLN